MRPLSNSSAEIYRSPGLQNWLFPVRTPNTALCAAAQDLILQKHTNLSLSKVSFLTASSSCITAPCEGANMHYFCANLMTDAHTSCVPHTRLYLQIKSLNKKISHSCKPPFYINDNTLVRLAIAQTFPSDKEVFLKPRGELFQVPQFTVAPSWSQPVRDTTPSLERSDFLRKTFNVMN